MAVFMMPFKDTVAGFGSTSVLRTCRKAAFNISTVHKIVAD